MRALLSLRSRQMMINNALVQIGYEISIVESEVKPQINV